MRARNIKPGFYKNEDLAECEPLARILFSGLWCMADREGRLEDRPKRIKAELLPYDSENVDILLQQLSDNGLITRYEVGGEKYIHIDNFLKHQDPHYKEAPSVIPPPEGRVNHFNYENISEKKRNEILSRDGNKCLHCGSKDKLTIDHIVPRSKGGTSEDSNLQTLCKSCNCSKNNKLHSDINQSSTNHRLIIDQPSRVPEHADSLIPDSLIPDSLIPDSLIPEEPPITPQGAEGRKPTETEFDRFWKAYPRRVGKDAAKKAWGRRGRDRPELEKILSAIEAQKRSFNWQKDGGQYIPNPTTWLNQGRWSDEPTETEKRPYSDTTAKNIATIIDWEPPDERQNEIQGVDDGPRRALR